MDSSQSASSGGSQSNQLVIKVRELLVRAWKERWSEIQWGIHLKRIINSIPGADTRELAELLLQQALVGSHPNMLILSYIKHAIFSQVVPVTAAFRYITEYEEYAKPHCLLALVDISQEFAVHMNFNYGGESGLTLCKPIQSLIYWLLKVMLKSVQRCLEGRQPDYQSVLHTAAKASQKITESVTIRGLLYIAQAEDADTFREMEQTELNVRGTLSQIPADAIPEQVRQDVSSLSFLTRVKDLVTPSDPVLEVSHHPVCSTIVTMVALEAVLNPTNDVQPFVDQLFVLEKLMKLQRSYVFCELFRACFMGLVDIKAGENQEQYRWCAFTFLKVPQILLKIQQQSPSHGFSSELEMGFERLLQSSYMLDLVDIKYSCDNLLFLLNECTKINLLSETQHRRLSHKRTSESQKPAQSQEGNSVQPCASLIIRAEPTVNSILKTLDADYSKNQEALLGVLNHMLAGKSFELILAAAAATGKLQIFCFKLIKFNEYAKQSPGEGGKGSQTRALLFDISFLMLCHIVQVYGTETITTSSECMETFFVQWALHCLPEDGKYKSVDISMASDSGKVDLLLNSFTSGTDIYQGVPKWHEVCTNTPLAIQEVLFAWEHGALPSDKVKMILNYVKNRMLCLPVVVSTWLCSYINMLAEDARSKPLSMLQLLIQPQTADNSTQFYMERSHLMQMIVQKMINDILPPAKCPASIQYIPTNKFPAEVMETTMDTVFRKGWVDMTSLHTLESLLNLCGSDWFTDRLVKMMLDSFKVDELMSHLGIVFALCHMDLEHITLSLLLHTLPSYLLASDKHAYLTDPRGYTLAKMCVLAVSAAQIGKTSLKESTPMFRRGRKRSRKEFDLEDLDDIDSRPQKRSKTMEPQLTLDSEGFNFDFLNVKDDGEVSPTFETKDPLSKALINLFRLMNAIVHDGDISPKTSFIVSFIDEAVRCGHQQSRYILQFMPPNMLCQLLRSIPGLFATEHILQVCDLTNNTGRKIAAKAICQNTRFEG